MEVAGYEVEWADAVLDQVGPQAMPMKVPIPRLTARICQDGRDTVTTLADGTQVREGGRVVQATIFGKVLDGRPKIVYGDGEVVDKCE